MLHLFHCQTPQRPPLCASHFPRDSVSQCPNQALSQHLDVNLQQLVLLWLCYIKAKVSSLSACSFTLSPSPRAGRAVDTCMFFSNFSSSSNQLKLQPLVPLWPVACPLWWLFISLLCCLCSFLNKHVKVARVFGASLFSYSGPRASNIQATFPTQR